MANIKSQKKRVLTNEKAHLRNVAVKSDITYALSNAFGCGGHNASVVFKKYES